MEEDDLEAAFKATFRSPAGNKVLDYMKKKYYEQPSYTQGDTHHTAYLEGQRSLMRYILNVLEQRD